jgi:hypothetical protein
MRQKQDMPTATGEPTVTAAGRRQAAMSHYFMQFIGLSSDIRRHVSVTTCSDASAVPSKQRVAI